ncbi:MAG: alpha/beta-type small acid-soluble spore protein [Oscillospiraceae bacterium]|nr:alpha/beta-type small acid-soluble spore protein [Oscillospiraceae bacterium]
MTAAAARQTSQQALQKYKMEAAQELGFQLGTGRLTRKQAGQIGGRVVKKMVAAYEKNK